MTPTRSDYLVTTEWLEDHSSDPDLRVFESTIHLVPGPEGMKIKSGREDYDKGHIPGAAFLDLIADLSDASSELRFARLPLAKLVSAFSKAGVSDRSRVVIYSASGLMWATRVWWLLRSCGFENCAVLDGGLVKWKAEGRRVSTESSAYAPATFTARAREELWAAKDEVLHAISDGSVCTVNALPAAVHTGKAKMGYARPGHIKGSSSVPFGDLLDPRTETLLPDEQLRRHFEKAGSLGSERVITYCGGGIAATLDALALTLLGHPNVGVYDGSLDEWARDDALPMEVSV